MNTLLQDLRSGLRNMRQNPGFAAVVVLTIGIGIGANATIFSWIRPLLLNPLPGTADESRLVAVENFANGGQASGDPLTTSFLDFRDYRDHLRLLDVTAFGSGALAVGDERSSESIKVPSATLLPGSPRLISVTPRSPSLKSIQF